MLLKTARCLNRVVSKRPVFLSASRHNTGYGGEGKTTVHIINQEYEDNILIKSYSTYGFRLNNGITVLGPMAIFPRTVLSWQVHRSEDITTDSLRLFSLLDPKLDLLVIGLESPDRRHYDAVFRAARLSKLNIELLPVHHACSTFNFLNAEGRTVGAALIPPLHLTSVTDDDVIQTKSHYGTLGISTD